MMLISNRPSGLQRLVHDHLIYSGAKRFLNKNTRNCRRIRFLNKVFPDAKFIHIVRDGRAVVASLINVKFWKNLVPWILRGSTGAVNGNPDADEIELASYLWKAEIRQIYRDIKEIPSHRFYEITYENFTASPISRT